MKIKFNINLVEINIGNKSILQQCELSCIKEVVIYFLPNKFRINGFDFYVKDSIHDLNNDELILFTTISVTNSFKPHEPSFYSLKKDLTKFGWLINNRR